MNTNKHSKLQQTRCNVS